MRLMPMHEELKKKVLALLEKNSELTMFQMVDILEPECCKHIKRQSLVGYLSTVMKQCKEENLVNWYGHPWKFSLNKEMQKSTLVHQNS